MSFSALVIIVSFCFSQATGQQKTLISFMGAPGAGKGTLAGKCVTELKYGSLSVGNILREEIAKGTPLGKEAECINQGKFASDELVTKIVESWLEENLAKIDTIILDGFPRTACQAQLFLDLLHAKFSNVSFRVIELVSGESVVTQRLASRLVCEKCQMPESTAFLQDPTKLICATCGGNLIKRADDKAEFVPDRLKTHAQHAESLLELHNKAQVKIDRIFVENKTPQQVFDEFKKLTR